jgi:SAM-dependent methyltransferase
LAGWLSHLTNLGRASLPPGLYLWICERLYHEAAPLYDATAWLVSGGRWWRWTRAAASGLRGRAVEIGPGPGHLLRWLRRRGVRAVAVELSAPMARRAALRAPGVVAQGDGRALPLQTASVDALLLTFPAPYVREPAFWSEAARVVRPGGRLRILLDAGPAYLSPGSERVTGLDPRWRLRRARVRAGDATLGMLLGRRRRVDS